MDQNDKPRTKPMTFPLNMNLGALAKPETTHALVQLGEERTLSIIILDASPSMQKHGLVPQECVNEHFKAIRNPPDGRKQYCTVITFHDAAFVNIPLTPADQLADMNNYHTDGSSTLLWETVYQTLKLFSTAMPQTTNLKIFVGVFSDGGDNASDHERQPHKVKRMAQKVQALGWELFCFGIGIDGKKLAEDMGFPTDDKHVKTVAADEAGIREVTTHFSTETTTCHPSGFFKRPNP